jgi:putative transposase
LLVEIRAVLAACPFPSEGHRKVHCRLRAKEIRVGRKRVLRLMGEHHRLVPSRPRHEHGDPAPTGTIVTMRPDEMWGTDATRFYTERDGWCWFFGAVDHDTTEVMGWHIAKIGDPWAALEPIRQGMTMAFGSIASKVALGVALRLQQFRDLEKARAIIGAFITRYNTEWIVERLGYRTPAQARRDALKEAA